MKDTSFWSNYLGGHRMQGGWFPPVKLFLEKNGAMPSFLQFTSEQTLYFHYPTIEKILEEYLEGVEPSPDIVSMYYDTARRLTYVNERYCDLGNGLAIYFSDGYLKNELESLSLIPLDTESGYYICMEEITVLYMPSKRQEAIALQAMFHDSMLTVKVASTLNMVCKESYDYYLYPFEIKKPQLNIALNYGAEFVPLHETILNALSQKDRQGVVLLHGIPGSGKTHYIRYLINTLKDKELIYVPPDMAYALSAPDFLPFLMKHSNAVLVIEDAENIIRDRQTQDNQAVANLLNLSDGLLGDCLNLQIIATFNSDITKIDSALLRKGRLIAQWKFDKLPVDQAQNLSDSLGFQTVITESMTLAEIYGQNEPKPTQNNQNGKKIGF